MQGVTAGNIASVVASHSVGNSQDVPVFMVQVHLSLKVIVADKMAIHQDHVLILFSHTANLTG
jgi:hypothetical protein